jgi:predicted MFS family arabinose efflux permease
MMLLGTAVFCAGCLVSGRFSERQSLVHSQISSSLWEKSWWCRLWSVVIDELAPNGMRGSYFGAATLRQLGPTMGPALGGVVLSGAGATALFIFMAMVGGLSALCIRLSGNKETNDA